MKTVYLRLEKHSSKPKGVRDGYAYGTPELWKVLNHFQIQAKLIDVRSFHMLTPDSFLWKLRMSDGVYYLYAEDYVEKLEYVEKEIQEASAGKIGQFVMVKKPRPLEEHSAVKAASEYAPPESYEAMRPYAADSGYDLVFLYKLDNPDEDDL